MTNKSIVLLVDNKLRDLMGATLIAHHLAELGVDCHLEPVGAYRGVLAAYRPEMIVFNQLTSGHLVKYSHRLRDMGVLTAVLTNEGISYDSLLLKFIVGSHHTDAHIDYYFCWNEEKKQALREIGLADRTKIEIVGVPRFDFYFRPWSRIYEEERAPGKPRILVCTNFAHADFRDLPPSQAEKFFASVKGRVPGYDDPAEVVEIHHLNRLRFFDYLNQVVGSKQFDVVLRPHPFENKRIYRDWMAKLPPDLKAHTTLDSGSNITRLILNNDLQISCETCTTAIESWIARKPTIELVFQRHPIYFHAEHAANTPLCERPEDLVAQIKSELARPEQPAFLPARRAHLQKWCHSPDGTACQQAAESIARALATKRPADWTQLKPSDYRRNMKMQFMHSLGQNYQFDPLLALKTKLFPSRYEIKAFTHGNFIKPKDVVAARRQLEQVLAAPPGPR